MNNNNTISELLEEFPELKEDSEKLDKVIRYLENSKPNVEASMEFKDSLRKRLDSIIEIKTWNKKSFLFFIIPALSLCLVISLVFVYYKDFSKVKQPLKWLDNKIDETMIPEWRMLKGWQGVDNGGTVDIKNDNKQPIDKLGSWFESEKNTEKSPKPKDWINTLDSNLNTELNKWFEDLNIQDKSAKKVDSVSDENIWNEVDNVMNLLDELFEWADVENSWSSIPESTPSVRSIQYSTINEEKSNDLMPTTSSINLWNTTPSWVYSFKEYCTYEKWFIVSTWKGKSCRKKDKTECLESNFDWTSCKFVPINN